MPNDPEREALVREGVEQMLRLEAERPLIYDGVNECETLAEVVAVIVAEARAAEADESLWVEIAVKYISPSREKMIEARTLLKALGYVQIVPILSRLIKASPRKPAWLVANEKAKAAKREAMLAAHRARQGL